MRKMGVRAVRLLIAHGIAKGNQEKFINAQTDYLVHEAKPNTLEKKNGRQSTVVGYQHLVIKKN